MKLIKSYIQNLKYFKERLRYLKALFSPFKQLSLQWYFGKIAVGVPYFLPRRWVKNRDKPGYTKTIPKKFGFDFVSLGWKSKYGSFRFEHAPMVSFVFFQWQIAVTLVAIAEDHYWETWLNYEYNTDKTKSRKERIIECRKKYPQIWTTHSQDGKKTTDYYDVILKEKYKNINGQ